MNTLNQNPVREVAQADYRPLIASVNLAAIEALAAPSDLQGMGATLGNSPLATVPRVFVPYFVAMNTMNYQFWDVDSSGAFSRYGRDGKIGALAMQDAFHAAWLAAGGERTPEQAAATLARRVEAEGVEFIFGNIPEPTTRRELLLEVLQPTKLAAVSGYLSERVLNTGELGWGDAQLLAYLFPKAYGDRYLKKAQLTLMFIAGEWNAQRPTLPCELDVTAAADYQLPKVLHTLGLLVYGDDLAAAIAKEELLPADGEAERAIRAATILACDLLAERFGCSIAEVDFWLWLNRNKAREAKFHLTRTTAY